MSSSPTIVGDNTVLWGSGGVYSGTGAGYVKTASARTFAEKLTVVDQNGFTVAVIYFDGKSDVEFEMIIKTSAPAITVGTPLTICGIAYAIVDEFTQIWADKDVQKFRVRATNYVSITS